ncbi:response regulator [Clostridium prolinivorans]|uniref:response regulator n=1 Tax=Clostridium prolinivorans TaxID=2769420 RepID=UPI000FD8C8B9|nr:response regulator [Clostridium prolinivorans]
MISNTIKVLIVDDEYLVRNLLKKCIDWKSIGMEIVGEASSGEDAINAVDKYKPDLVFTDICMTNVDGIEFADIIIKKYPNIKVVVISGYDDFKYAQRSIRAGIKDYLLKPIDDEVVLRTALKMKKEIEEERETISEYNSLKKQFIENKSFFIERLLNRLIELNMDINEVKRQMSNLDFSFKYNNFQVAVLEVMFNKEGNYINDEEDIVYKFKIYDKVKEYFNQYEDINIFFDINYRITIINNGDSSILQNFLKDIKLKFLSDFNYSIGIGGVKNGIQNIEKSYKEALMALKNYNSFKKHNKLIDDITNYVRENIEDTEMSLSKVSHVFFINSSYLSRIFKKEMGINFMEYLTKLRIDKAKMLIKNTDLKAYEIAEKVGISDPSYFSTCFKKYTGVSISEYKKK